MYDKNLHVNKHERKKEGTWLGCPMVDLERKLMNKEMWNSYCRCLFQMTFFLSRRPDNKHVTRCITVRLISIGEPFTGGLISQPSARQISCFLTSFNSSNMSSSWHSCWTMDSFVTNLRYKPPFTHPFWTHHAHTIRSGQRSLSAISSAIVCFINTPFLNIFLPKPYV